MTISRSVLFLLVASFLCAAPKAKGLQSLSGTMVSVVGVGLPRPLGAEEALFTVFVIVKLNVIMDALVCPFRRDLWSKNVGDACSTVFKRF